MYSGIVPAHTLKYPILLCKKYSSAEISAAILAIATSSKWVAGFSIVAELRSLIAKTYGANLPGTDQRPTNLLLACF